MRFSIPRLFKHVRDQPVARVLTGAMAVPWYGPATLTLTAPNTYTGGTTINGGTLALGTSGTLGGATSTITVDAGNSATLDLLGTADKTITSGTITLNAGSQLTVTRSEFVAATQSATSFTGALSGAGNLVIGGLSGAVTGRRTRFASSAPLGTGGAFDNFSGDITVQSGANLALFNGTLTSANSNNLTVDSGGYVTLLGNSTTFVGALSGGGFITRNNGSGTTATLSVASGNFSGVISQTLLSGGSTVALTKTGNGTLTLTGANTYTGATTVNAGTLIIAAADSLGTGAGTVNSGGTLTYAADTTGVRTVTVNAGGTINKGGFAHTGTVFVNNGGTINP